MKRKKIYLGILMFLLVVVGATTAVFEFSYSRGMRSGRLVKLSRKGVLLKEWEGMLDLGSGDRLTWDFSIHDDEIGDELAQQMGQWVTVDYKEHLFRWIYLTKYDVTNWRNSNINPDKNCPFLYLLHAEAQLQQQTAQLIMKERKDLAGEVQECLQRLKRSTP